MRDQDTIMKYINAPDSIDDDNAQAPSSERYYIDDSLNFDIYKDEDNKKYNTYLYTDDNDKDKYNEDALYDLLYPLYEAGSMMTHGGNESNKGINFTQEHKRTSKEITDKDDLKLIFSLTHDIAAQKSTVMDFFADFGDGPKFQPYWLIKVPAGAYGGYSKINKENNTSKKSNIVPFTTTVGLYVYNKMFIEPMSDILGYINTTISSKVYKKINQEVSYALIEDKITVRAILELKLRRE